MSLAFESSILFLNNKNIHTAKSNITKINLQKFDITKINKITDDDQDCAFFFCLNNLYSLDFTSEL